MLCTSVAQETIFGDGALNRLDGILHQLDAQSVFLVRGGKSFESCGAKRQLQSILCDRTVTQFSEFTANPKIEDVEYALQRFRAKQPDAIIAVGGGTAIDIAKMVGFCAAHAATPREVVDGIRANSRPVPPLIAVPTTAGSGSESTHFAVVYVDSRKHSVADPAILPHCCIVDPKLTYSLSPHLTAVTGLDALCQAIESLWSVNSTAETRELSREAVQLSFEQLYHAVHQPAPNSRAAMCRASQLAGQAINQTKTTAPHALSYTMTIRYGIPHGLAVALTLPQFLIFNQGVTDQDVNDDRGVAHVRSVVRQICELLGTRTVQAAATKLRTRIASLGLPSTLIEAGIKDRELHELVDNVNLERLANNPRKVSLDSLLKILGVASS